MLVAKVCARLKLIRELCQEIEDTIPAMQEIENQWRQRVKDLEYQWKCDTEKMEYECRVLKERIAALNAEIEGPPTKALPFAWKIGVVNPGVENCPRCTTALEKREAFRMYNSNYAVLDAFLFCPSCKRHFAISFKGMPRCKSKHCKNPAFHNGFCFECLKHDNYEVR